MTTHEPGRLILVATPIGNLGDISQRAVETLRDADLVACEDTRRTATLLRHIGVETPMLPAHEHNESARAADLVRRMREGHTVALVTDAGMPVVSDPGARVVRAAIDAGIEVTVVPGPSAVESAVALSGLPASPYVFVGFFPRRRGERQELVQRVRDTMVGFESPHRLASLLQDLAEVEHARPVAVCRELTKLHEEVLRGTVAEMAERMTGGARGEVTVVLGPGVVEDAGVDVHEVVGVLLEAGLSARASADVAARLGLASHNAAYRAALADPSRSST